MKKITSAERLRFLFQIARKQKTGIVTIRGGKSPRNFVIDGGTLRLACGADPVVYFQELIAEGELIKPRRLNRALKAQEAEGGFLLAHIARLGYAGRDELVEILDFAARKELTRFIDEPGGSTRFQQQDPDLDSLGEGVEEFLLDRSLEAWVLDAAGAREAIEIFEPVFPSHQEVLVALEGATAAGAGVKVLDLIDGVRTIEQIIAEATCDSYEAVRGLYELERDGQIRRRPVAEIIELATRFQKEGRIDNSQRMYLLAQMQGADDTEITLCLGRNFELMGDEEAAVGEYIKYATRAESEGRIDEALRGLRRGIELQQNNVLIRESVLRILDETGDKEAADREVAALVPILMDERCHDRARDLLVRTIRGGAIDPEVCDRLATCFCELGELEREAFVALLDTLESDELAAAVLPIHDYLAARMPDDIELRIRRALALADADRGNEGAELMSSCVAELTATDRSGAEDRVEWVRRGLELLVSQNREERTAREWLAALYEANGSNEQAARHLEELGRILRAEGDIENLCHCYDRLMVLDPERRDLRREKGRAYLDAGRAEAGAEILRQIARQCADEDRGEAASILDELLERRPADLEAIQSRVELARQEEDAEVRGRWLRRGSRLAMALENWSASRDLLIELAELQGAAGGTLRERIECLENLGDDDALGACWVELAQLERAAGNAGAMAEACEKALAIDPDNDELRSWITPEEIIEEEKDSEPVEQASEAGAVEAPATSRGAFGSHVLELMKNKDRRPEPAADRKTRPAAKPAPSRIPMPEPEPEQATDPVPEPVSVTAEAAAPVEAQAAPRSKRKGRKGKGKKTGIAAKIAAARAVAGGASPAPQEEIEETAPPAAGDITPGKFGSEPEEKPSISGIVERLKSMKG